MGRVAAAVNDRQGFWEQKHRSGELYWLTGSRLANYRAYYGIDPKPGQKVTEIGIGTGAATREFTALKCEVSAVDISHEARKRVCGFAVPYKSTELLLVPPADLAIMHLVAQHVDTDTLRDLMRVPLAPSGMFHFQTAWAPHGVSGSLSEDMHGLVWHDPIEVYGLAEDVGLTIESERRLTFDANGTRVDWALFRARAA